MIPTTRSPDDFNTDGIIRAGLGDDGMVDLHGINQLLQMGGMAQHLDSLPEGDRGLEREGNHSDFGEIVFDISQKHSVDRSDDARPRLGAGFRLG